MSSFIASGQQHALVRTWQEEHVLRGEALVYPVFVVEGADKQEPIGAMPGQFRWSVDRLPQLLEPLLRDGLRSVLLFGVIQHGKDALATRAITDNPVVQACQFLRKEYPELFIITDVCLCAYTDHGHCGVMNEERAIDNERSTRVLADVAVAYARAGAQMVAPSDMMDGRIAVIKSALREAGLGSVPVMSYAAKFASCFYGPFRAAACSGMSFGDRKAYQLPPGSRGMAIRAVERDVRDGADIVMVKPGMPYLDIIRDTRERTHTPVAVYQVSGEYAMLYHASQAGAMDLKTAVLESMQAFLRAGAGIIITYFAPEVLRWLRE